MYSMRRNNEATCRPYDICAPPIVKTKVTNKYNICC